MLRRRTAEKEWDLFSWLNRLQTPYRGARLVSKHQQSMPPQRTSTKGITSSRPWEISVRFSLSLTYPNTCKLRREAIHQRARVVSGRISVDYASSLLSVLPHSDLVEFLD